MATAEAGSTGTPRRGWLESLGLHRPELRAWALYDWANSAMVTTIIAAVFPIYFSKVACAGFPEGKGAQTFATITTVGMVIIAVLAPILGAIADTRPIKKRLLGGFLVLGVGSVAAMYFIQRGDWVLASTLFILANIGANGSFVFYDSLLPHIARDGEMDRVSTAGYALGYVGGGLLLAANLAWIQKPEWFGLPTVPTLSDGLRLGLRWGLGGLADPLADGFARSPVATLPARLAFLSVAVWWAVFAIPLFRRVPEPRIRLEPGESPGGNALKEAFVRLGETGRELRRYKAGFLMLLAFLIYNDGIGTIIRMATVYGEELGISQGVMILSLVVVQFVGIPFAFGFGLLAERFRPKTLILASLVVYVGIGLLGYFMRSDWHFVLLAVLVATVQGGSQALSRSLFASLIPRSKSGEFFGFFAVVEKFAGIAGPALFALSLAATGSTRVSILTVIPFFLVGGLLLLMVDVEGGRAAAREADERAKVSAHGARDEVLN
jgi:UMF1 family MFS transporter